MIWSGLSRVAVAIVLLAATATGASAQDDVTGVDNRALLDADRTADTLGAAKSISEKLFTFDYTQLAEHKRTFNELTTGDLASEYDKVFGSMEEQAAETKFDLKSTVREAAVRTLTENHATVLVFLDQTSTRGDNGQSTQAGAMFLASLETVNGDWKMSKADLFEGR